MVERLFPHDSSRMFFGQFRAIIKQFLAQPTRVIVLLVPAAPLKFVLLALAILTGFAMAALSLPAAFLSGPLLLAAIFSIANRPVIRFPLFFYRLAQSVIGVMLSFPSARNHFKP
jgi:uncharacterized membrane protein AbrB (regulator of aidB expression)